MRQFFVAIVNAWKGIFSDVGVLLIFVIAPVIYGLYYPLPYSNQTVRNLPVAIVDQAQDSVSRKLIRMVSAAPALTVQIASDERTVKRMLRDEEIMAFMIIPAGLKRNVTMGMPATVNMVGNGGYVLASKYAQQAMAEATLALSEAIEIQRLSASGLGAEKIDGLHEPVPLKTQLLFNRNEGYGSYVVPAVAWLILQQTLLISCAMLVSTWWEERAVYAEPSVWLGRITGISLLHYLICLGYTGMMFHFWGYPTGKNIVGNLLLIGLFSPCVATLGCLFGLLIKDRERTMQLLVFSALPMYFLSGFSWPTELLPEILQYIRWVLPCTSAIHAGLSFNQLGGTISDNMHYLIALACIAWIGLMLLFWFGRQPAGEDVN